MFFKNKPDDSKYTVDAISKSMAVIEFDTVGNILTANSNFLGAIGYSLEEIQGKHHRMFVDPAYACSSDYSDFWASLGAGRFDAAEYKRLGKNGKEIWIQASYNPVMDAKGRVIKVVKFATDITAEKLKNADLNGQIEAISKSQAVIQFNMDGTIMTANGNFLGALGYTLDEIKGKHHRMFVEPSYAQSIDYQNFWSKLNRGEFDSGQYCRIGAGGKQIWIEASYNPIFDMNGKAFKIVKYASVISQQVEVRQQVQKYMGDIESAVAKVEEQAVHAAGAANQSAQNMQAIATGAEEMTASVQEIASSMTKSLSAVQKATEETGRADQATAQLDAAANAMSGIVVLIQGIAGQINLLALNATIEAARAGEAGKGFAVVADEVKSLAKQAADATEQISKEIEGVQNISKLVVSSLHEIKSAVRSVENHVSGAASAVEEQTAVTKEISQNMQTTSDAVTSISSNVISISDAVQSASSAVQTTRKVASSLS